MCLLELVIYGAGPGRDNPTRCIGLGHKPKPRYPSGKCPYSLQVLSSCPMSPMFTNLSYTQQRTSCLSAQALKNVNYLVCPPNSTPGGAVINISLVGFLERIVCLLLRRVLKVSPLCPHTHRVHWSSGFSRFGQGHALPASSSSHCEGESEESCYALSTHPGHELEKPWSFPEDSCTLDVRC